jgi:hypothetical protein
MGGLLSFLGTAAPPQPQPLTQDEIDTFIRINTAPLGGPQLWNMFNAIAFLLLVLIGIFGVMGGLQQLYDYQTVVANWKDYRCQPLIMPLASFYGHDTAENFEFCLKDIFMNFAKEITAPFLSILNIFFSIIQTISKTILSIKESIATLIGGIFNIFQDFKDRIMNFFFQIRLSAIRIRNMIFRMTAIMYSVVYMGASGIKATTNFGNTFLFSFLDTFCFPPETEIAIQGKGLVPLYQVQVGDILVPTKSRVTGKFHFAAQGQPMVQLKDGIQVSTNHYVLFEGQWIPASEHPDATPLGPYTRQSLICLNTEDHVIPMGRYTFRDYDETAEADSKTMDYIQSRVNGKLGESSRSLKEASATLHPETLVRLADGSQRPAKHLTVGLLLSTGDRIAGLVHKEVSEICYVNDKEAVGSATLIWDPITCQWIRAGLHYPLQLYESPIVFIGLIALTGSQIELGSGRRIRDYMELCSPDAEQFYAECLSDL